MENLNGEGKGLFPTRAYIFAWRFELGVGARVPKPCVQFFGTHNDKFASALAIPMQRANIGALAITSRELISLFSDA